MNDDDINETWQYLIDEVEKTFLALKKLDTTATIRDAVEIAKMYQALMRSDTLKIRITK